MIEHDTQALERLRARIAKRRRVKYVLPGYRASAVLTPMLVRPEGLSLLFIQRTLGLAAHPGQIAFPGGKVESQDADLAACALRESGEEVGLLPASAEVLGLLDDVPTPSGFVISPVVALFREPPALSPNQREVAEVFTAPMRILTHPSCLEDLGEREVAGMRYRLHAYHYEGRRIWGATARIVKQLLDLAYTETEREE
jgi:8-oxo-dGTP pyrophosphatase MutT (NUDIX family)